MNYTDFKLAFATALTGSGLAVRADPSERLDLCDLERTYEVFIEPPGGQDAAPFDVGATLSWEWDALHEARSAKTEEEMLSRFFGRGYVDTTTTERPRIRVDVTLLARLSCGEPLPMPPQSALRAWMHEVLARLRCSEPLLPEDVAEVTDDGNLALFEWWATPQVKATCEPDGALSLDGVELMALQCIDLPRFWDDRKREDDGPEAPLATFFERVRWALHLWMETLDHLVPAPGG